MSEQGATSVSIFIGAAFDQSRSRYPELDRSWVYVSHHIGGLLSSSLLFSSIYKAGRLDLVLRCMEDENVSSNHLDAFEHYISLAETWVGAVYEILRVLKERKLVEQSEVFLQLAEDTRLLRVALEKHEVPSDRKLTGPIQFRRWPPQGDASDEFSYSKEDPQKSHIMPSGLSSKGAVVWKVSSGVSDESRWVERRGLADRILTLWQRAPDS
jgi:hypothetical protein